MYTASFLHRVKRCVGCSTVLLLLFQVTTFVSYGQTSAWTRPIPLSPQDSFAWFPDVIADGAGTVHVAWASSIADYDTVMYSASQDGINWSDVTDIEAAPQIASGSEATRPALFADKQGILHITFRDTTVYYSHARIESAFSAAAWLVPERMSGDQIAYFSRLAQDTKGVLHMVFTENIVTPECPICFHLFYRQSDESGANWSAPVDISDSQTGSAKPQILIDNQDYIHVVWEAGIGGSYGQLVDPTKIMYAASYDQGQTWTSPVELSIPNSVAKDVTIGRDGNGSLLVVWLGLPEDMVYYQVSRDYGLSWSSPKAVQGLWGGWSVYQARLDDYTVATDSAGHIHLALVGRTSQDRQSLSVLHLEWDGSDWSTPDVVTTLLGDVPEWPRIAVGRGNQLHLVWFVRDQAHIWSGGSYRVWYAQGASSAPMTTPYMWPTVTPTASPYVVVPLTPTPTLASQVAPELPHVSTESLYTEANSVIVLAKSLLAGLGLIAVVAVGIFIRRR